MGNFPKIPTTDELKTKADEALSKVPSTAQEYFDKMCGTVTKTKVVSDLVTDVKENPGKVGREAGVAGAVGAAVFAGLRLYDSYVAGKGDGEESSEASDEGCEGYFEPELPAPPAIPVPDETETA